MEDDASNSAIARKPNDTFLRAFHQYVQNLPEKKNKKSVLSRLDLSDPPTPELIQQAMRTVEARHAQKPSVKMMKRILGPVISAMKDYYGVLDTITQADPTPGMVVWGALKIVIDGLGRYVELFDKIKAEVMSLTTQLTRLALYEDLYGKSTEMQDHLFRSYVNVFRFWCRVDKECNRCSLSTLLRATASFSLKKLQSIVNDLKENADEIDKLVPIIEGKYAGNEREEARIERSKNQKERDENSEWRKQMLCDQIQSWLGEKNFNEATLTRHQNNVNVIESGGTCDWLINNSKFQEWLTGDPEKPILWLFAGPGTGKSILCSHAYRHAEETDLGLDSTVALHFYEFDNQHSATAVARGLAAQLFAHYRCLRKDVSENLRQASQKYAANLSTVLQFIRILIDELPRTYIFFDGLDEECTMARWKEAVKIINFFIALADASPKKLRIWFSSQNNPVVRSKLGHFPTLNIGDQVGIAVDDFISSRVPGLENPEVDQSSRDWILDRLKSRAEGNFLWATLMLKMIENDASSFDEMERLVKEGLPRDLDHYYHQIFSRYENTERELASKIFAMITFAKRRLRLSELREAIGIFSSNDPKMLRQACIPWRQAVEKLFAPLIEIQPDPQNKDDCFCHLFHGTVETFLLKNEEIFLLHETKNTHLVSEDAIARACLLYLLQDKYSQFLVSKSGQWFTSSEENVEGHHFLTYAAKYWDKHLDHIRNTTDLQSRVESLLVSTNFRTLLQVQSLFVESQFGMFSLVGQCKHQIYIRRVLPAWFVASKRKEDPDFSGSYRSFISEWRSFLDCGPCQNQGCINAKFAGELDRYLWGALGPQNFLSAHPDRYNSFMLSNNSKSTNGRPNLYFDGIAADGRHATVLQVLQDEDSTTHDVNLELSQKTWDLNSDPRPSLLFQGDLDAEIDHKRWEIFATDSDAKRSKPVSFSPDLSHVRVGFQLFSLDSDSHYIKISGLELDVDKAWSYEQLVNRGRILVLASRRKLPKYGEPLGKTSRKPKAETAATKVDASVIQDSTSVDCDCCSLEAARPNEIQQPSQPEPPSKSAPKEKDGECTDQSSSNENRDDDRGSQTSSSSTDSDDCASIEESWSEGSTDATQYDKMPWNELDTSEEESHTDESEKDVSGDSEASEDENSAGEPATSYGQLLDDDESDGGDIDFGFGSDDDAYQGDSDNSGISSAVFGSNSDNEDDNMMAIIRFLSARSKRPMKHEKGHLVIYDLELSPPKVLFDISPMLPLMLYESPPVIHPTKPLVVWPLFGGDILFIDFEGKTHFTRRARPTTKQTRHISMKCHFSPCGQYLHLVSLEGQQRLPSKADRKAGNKSSLVLSAFISTHRLSTRKTARSPPVLIHRAKASLGTTNSLNPSKLPVEITWSLDHVYLSSSSENNLLTLLRIELFPPKPSEAQKAVIMVPRLPIILPQSAQARRLHYFPSSKPNDTSGLVIIGSWSRNPDGENQTPGHNKERAADSSKGRPETTSPPIGFYVDEQKDLGGWIPSNASVEMDPGNDKGVLKAKMERFAPVDDCDIESFFFQHPSKY